MTHKHLWLTSLALTACASLCEAQEPVSPPLHWRDLAVSVAVQGAASGFDAWTSWQRHERNGVLANGGRFTTRSAVTKASVFTGVTIFEATLLKKWSAKRPWLARACRIGNFVAAGMMFSAGMHNLAQR